MTLSSVPEARLWSDRDLVFDAIEGGLREAGFGDELLLSLVRPVLDQLLRVFFSEPERQHKIGFGGLIDVNRSCGSRPNGNRSLRRLRRNRNQRNSGWRKRRLCGIDGRHLRAFRSSCRLAWRGRGKKFGLFAFLELFLLTLNRFL